MGGLHIHNWATGKSVHLVVYAGESIATESTEEVRFHYVFIDGYWKVMYRTPEGWKMKALALALRRCPE